MTNGNGGGHGGHGTPYWKRMIRRTMWIMFFVNVLIIFSPALINMIYTHQGFHAPSLYLMWPSIAFWIVVCAITALFNIT